MVKMKDCQKAAKKWELVDTNTVEEWLDWAERHANPTPKLCSEQAGEERRQASRVSIKRLQGHSLGGCADSITRSARWARDGIADAQFRQLLRIRNDGEGDSLRGNQQSSLLYSVGIGESVRHEHLKPTSTMMGAEQPRHTLRHASRWSVIVICRVSVLRITNNDGCQEKSNNRHRLNCPVRHGNGKLHTRAV